MNNKAMERKVALGEAIDVSNGHIGNVYYKIDEYREGVDYCDAKNEIWIWSIGRRYSDGLIIAASNTSMYQNPEFECLWLR